MRVQQVAVGERVHVLIVVEHRYVQTRVVGFDAVERLQEFEPLDPHAAFLRRLARGLIGDEQLAEDACQDAVLATLRRPAPQHVSPVAWLTTITRRAALSLRRRFPARLTGACRDS